MSTENPFLKVAETLRQAQRQARRLTAQLPAPARPAESPYVHLSNANIDPITK